MEASATDQGEGPSSSKPPSRYRLKMGGKGSGGAGGGGGGKGDRAKKGFSMWELHESSVRPLSVVPTTAIALLDTYIVTVAKKFPDDAGVQVMCAANERVGKGGGEQGAGFGRKGGVYSMSCMAVVAMPVLVGPISAWWKLRIGTGRGVLLSCMAGRIIVV